jgi:hypothetical protein
MYTASMIAKYLKFSSLDVDTRPLEDFVYYFDHSNDDHQQVLVRYDGKFGDLIVAVHNTMADIEGKFSNPYAMIITAYCNAIMAKAHDDRGTRERSATSLAMYLSKLFEMVVGGRDGGVSESTAGFAQIFAALVDAAPPSPAVACIVFRLMSPA